jgi:hypothetical protein
MERVELRVSLSPDNRIVTLEMLVDGKSVGQLPMGAGEVDYHIQAMTRMRQGMTE